MCVKINVAGCIDVCVCVPDLDANFANNCWIRLLLGVQSATDENPELDTPPSTEHRILHQ